MPASYVNRIDAVAYKDWVAEGGGHIGRCEVEVNYESLYAQSSHMRYGDKYIQMLQEGVK
jgi:hypothetical protein